MKEIWCGKVILHSPVNYRSISVLKVLKCKISYKFQRRTSFSNAGTEFMVFLFMWIYFWHFPLLSVYWIVFFISTFNMRLLDESLYEFFGCVFVPFDFPKFYFNYFNVVWSKPDLKEMKSRHACLSIYECCPWWPLCTA